MSTPPNLKNRTMLAILAVCSVGLCVLLAMKLLRGGAHAGTSGDAYFLDLNTNTLFVSSSSSIPPIEAPSGAGPAGKQAGVRAHVFSCDESSRDLNGMTLDQISQSGAYIGYLEKRTDAFKAYITQSETGTPPDPNLAARMVKQPNLISEPDGKRWVPDVSPEGQKILQKGRNGCEGAAAYPCHPN